MTKSKFVCFVFVCSLLFSLLFSSLAMAEAGVASQLKIISPPQTLEVNASSSVITIESQDDSGTSVNVSTTTRASLSSSSVTGKFASSPSSGPCGTVWTVNSVTISKGTAHKSFCYMDETPGNYLITVSVPDQASVTPAVWGITIISQTSSSTSDSSATTTEDVIVQDEPSPPPVVGGGQPSQETLTKSAVIKISEILPNPEGTDEGMEAVELENFGGQAVNLDGWYLGDKTDSGIKSSAYRISNLSINPFSVLLITLPKGSFALNNSGGEAVNLYFSDKSLADSVAYTDDAKEGFSYQKVGSSWIWSKPSLGQKNFQTQSIQSANNNFSAQVFINEILANPEGQDEGREWVEFYNPTDQAISLDGWILDDEGSGEPGSNSFVLESNAMIPGKGYFTVTITEDKFTLDNTGEETLRLFNPQKNLVESVTYKDAPENRSYSKNSSAVWEFGIPTPGKINSVDVKPFNLIVSELLPNPASTQDEFVEIFNPGDLDVNLADFSLQIGTAKKIFKTTDVIKAKSYFVVYEEDLPARLRNSGQTVSFYDFLGRQIANVTYSAAESGESYATTEGKNYIWTSSVTPEKANEMVLGASVDKEISNVKASTSAKESAVSKTAGITPAEVKKILKADSDIKNQLVQMQETINQLSSQIFSQARAAEDIQAGSNSAAALSLPSTSENKQKNQTWIFVLSICSLILLVFIFRKFVKF